MTAVAILAVSTFSLADTGSAVQQVLTSLDFNIVGVGLKASPEYQAVPKGIATKVNAVIDY